MASEVTFYTVSKTPRPVRLNEQTRRFAYESLNHRYGLDTKKTPSVSLDDVPGYESLSELQQYDAAIAEIAKSAPLRVCEGERLSGAATLWTAVSHAVPATYQGNVPFPSISHLTIDFETVLKRGIRGLREDIARSMDAHRGEQCETAFLQSAASCLDSMEVWRARYLAFLKDKPAYRDNYNALCRVPFEPATSFYEALQSLWFTFAFVRLCGNWPGIGRIDVLLGDYLKRDLDAGKLTYDDARELLAHFFIKGCEWVAGGDYGSGDAQHYQNIVLGGRGADGSDITNEVTYLVLDVLEELNISDFPTTMRFHKHSPEKLFRRAAEVMRHGGGVLAVYNEDLILDSLTRYGYPLEEARQFANDGCWEVQIPGKTYFMYRAFDVLQLFQQLTLDNYNKTDFPSFDALFDALTETLSDFIERMYYESAELFGGMKKPSDEWHWVAKKPTTVVSVFEQGCIENARSYLEGGPRYVVISPHIGGLPDAANSLYAIKKLVFEEKRLTLPELFAILRNNWEGEEALRQYVRTHYVYFGNDNDEVDAIAAKLLDRFADACACFDGISPIKFPPGVSTFGRQIGWRYDRLASPHGYKTGDILSGNLSPTPGTDTEGATAIIKSYCKADLTRQVTGAALDIKLLPDAVRGEDGLAAIEALIRGFLTLGGHFMQIDVIDNEVLKLAQQHPEDYQSLSVRVSGWNARFVTLDREWQQMIIERNGQQA